jgi:hypothetical protein
MLRLTIAYIAVLLAGLAIIESRIGWSILSSNRGSDFPTIVAVTHFLFTPDSMQYVAASDLKKGHELEETDLAADPKLAGYLLTYLPMKNSRVGKNLQRDVTAGQPIRPEDLGSSPPITPEKGAYIVRLLLRQQPSAPHLLESQASVTLSFPTTTEKLAGTVVSSVKAIPGPTAQLNNAQP